MFQRGRNEAVKKNLRCWGVGVLLGVAVLAGAHKRRRPGPRGRLNRQVPDGQGRQTVLLAGRHRLDALPEPDREDVELYLATRARQGFTVIQAAVVMGEERVAGTKRPNAYGDNAFRDHDPARPRLTPGNNPAIPTNTTTGTTSTYVIDRAQAHGLSSVCCRCSSAGRATATSTSRPPTPTLTASSWASDTGPSRTSSGSSAATTSQTPRKSGRSGTRWPRGSPRRSPDRRTTAGR